VAPLITPTVPAVLGNSVVGIFSGTSLDPAPIDAQVASLEIQRDSEDWELGTLYAPDSNGEHLWSSIWLLPSEDGVTHTVRFRATDYGNNVTTTGWYTTVVDTIAPVITVTQALTQTSLSQTPVLSGLVTDGHAVSSLTVWVYPSAGDPTYIDVTPVGEEWSYQPNLAAGAYRLYIQAEDTAGNQVLYGPFDLTILDLYLLTVTPAGNGTGTITSTPSGIDCNTASGGDCAVLIDTGTVVTLTATTDTGSTFSGWEGADCVGTGDCVLSMTETKAVTATFTLDQYLLTVATDGTGSGSVSSDPAGIDCPSAGGGDCDETLDYGTLITLTAGADSDSVFSGWSGACDGSGNCQITMTETKSVTASFTLVPPGEYALSVSLAGDGAGTVTGTGINCFDGGGADCTETYTDGTVITLTASTDSGSIFTSWGGACTNTTGDCVVTMDAAKLVTATFTLVPPGEYALSVSLAGDGSGNVTGTGINCFDGVGADCIETYTDGTIVYITASADSGSTFSGWSGACTNTTGDCEVTMTEAQFVTATFTTVTNSIFLPLMVR